jgi:NADH-quinone oxidoreductase subunit L
VPLVVIPLLPLAAFLLIGLGGRRLSDRAVALVAGGAAALAFVAAGSALLGFSLDPPAADVRVEHLWSWFAVGDFAPRVALRADALSLVMALMVTGVGALILLYSVEYMRGDEGFPRFFATMSLFLAFMLVLVLADDLLLLLLGWEGVGLASYLLIGFWYRDAQNGAAAQKAFIVTRLGDAAMVVGLLLLFTELGTLAVGEVGARAAAAWTPDSPVAVWAAALLLAGAIGKSAQVPLQVWLPDAMAGPTPVSALIHAATMVAAGVFLLARLSGLFSLAPSVLVACAAIGAVTLVLAGLSAAAQRDIKRVLAYSTISQLGYMFLAVGVGAYAAAVFHLVVHAFFKAALFLAAGAVIHATGEKDLFAMGGLRRRLPVAFITMVIAGASLAALPLVTAGFYSKEQILFFAWAGERGAAWLWLAGIAGTFVTGLYIARLVFLAFFGEERAQVRHPPGSAMRIPLVVLAALSIVAGFLETPELLGGLAVFSGFLERAVVPAAVEVHALGLELGLALGAVAASILGIALAWRRYLVGRAEVVPDADLPGPARAQRLLAGGFGFDAAYRTALARPLARAAHENRDDFLDSFYDGVAAAAELGHRGLSRTQTGRVRDYAGAIGIGIVVLLLLAIVYGIATGGGWR